tara:strand:+ start:571 stop:714 length:144 start_codon:yes stop_codon:yes gene_type:complete
MQNITTSMVHINSMFFCGGEIGSTDAGVFKKVNANDNFAPTGYALAA